METERTESRFKEVTIIKKQRNDLAIERSCTFFKGDIDGLKLLKVEEDICKKDYNKHLLVPLHMDQLVYEHPEQSNVPSGFLRVIQQIDNNKLVVAIFLKKYFITPH